MSRKLYTINPENSTMVSFGIEKITEIRYLIMNILRFLNEHKNDLENEKEGILKKLDDLMLMKEKFMVNLNKYELDIELKRLDGELKRRPQVQSQESFRPMEYEKINPFEFEKKNFYHKLFIIMKKLEYEALIVKFKKVGNNMKTFCIIWDTFFVVYIYIEKSKSKSIHDKNRIYRIFDIVATKINDKGSKSISPPSYFFLNDMREIKELKEKDYENNASLSQRSRIIETKIQFLKKCFETHFSDLVFEPNTFFFQKISFFIKKVFFYQKSQTYIEFDSLFCWYFDGYKQLFTNEDIKCFLCGNKMIFDSPKTGFLPCTVFKNNKFYHDRCFIHN